ncbi:transmembrane protein 266-like isoform X1 [Acipenser ruthenus]|uniref:transmembrane protein 266-like isoform X1 n=1 Tax=Acipenser ruthenus TaxID=7906 RepID=UPI00145BE361|nr:transmembrane protein 266-like isoform X1 [Acipenser ruthenus]XP_058851275.1 transmembrane protein 266-like isoform X1 [Acipenser ruthenus]
MSSPQSAQKAEVSDLEIISQQVEEESQCIAPVQLVNFAYRDLPLTALDLSLAGSQLLSNPDEEDQRESSNWLKPCCGRRAAIWQVFLLSAALNCFLVACVVLVVVLLALELLIDTKLLQFTNAFQFASIIHWISLVILSVFFTETVFRIVVLGVWDYIENKVEVFDGAVIVLSLAPMVASTVANGPSSPWDAISLIITLRIWRVKRIIDAYVVPVKVEMEMVIEQYEKAKAVREEQLERLTQICQEQAFEIRQLWAHLGQQDLDLAVEREAAMQIHRVWNKQSSQFKVLDGLATGESDDEGARNIRESRQPQEPVVRDDMNNYISQYYSEPSSDVGVPEAGTRVITTTAIDVHLPSNPHYISSDLLTVEAPGKLQRMGSSVSDTSGTVSRSTDSSTTRNQSGSSQTLGSSTDCSTTREGSSDYCPVARSGGHHHHHQEDLGPAGQRDASAVVQELLSSLTEDSCLAQKRLDPVNLKLPSPAGSNKTSPELEHRMNIYNKKNQESLNVCQTKPLIHFHGNEPTLEEKYRFLEPAGGSLSRPPDT